MTDSGQQSRWRSIGRRTLSPHSVEQLGKVLPERDRLAAVVSGVRVGSLIEESQDSLRIIPLDSGNQGGIVPLMLDSPPSQPDGNADQESQHKEEQDYAIAARGFHSLIFARRSLVPARTGYSFAPACLRR